ncbi:hypothetical protein PMIN03_011036 [Paraphaeosphaeria minitans]
MPAKKGLKSIDPNDHDRIFKKRSQPSAEPGVPLIISKYGNPAQVMSARVPAYVPPHRRNAGQGGSAPGAHGITSNRSLLGTPASNGRPASTVFHQHGHEKPSRGPANPPSGEDDQVRLGFTQAYHRQRLRDAEQRFSRTGEQDEEDRRFLESFAGR